MQDYSFRRPPTPFTHDFFLDRLVEDEEIIKAQENEEEDAPAVIPDDQRVESVAQQADEQEKMCESEDPVEHRRLISGAPAILKI
jgi:hypothetical protein